MHEERGQIAPPSFPRRSFFHLLLIALLGAVGRAVFFRLTCLACPVAASASGTEPGAIRVDAVEEAIAVVIFPVSAHDLGVFKLAAEPGAIRVYAVDEAIAVIIEAVVTPYFGVLRPRTDGLTVRIIAVDEAIAVVIFSVAAALSGVLRSRDVSSCVGGGFFLLFHFAAAASNCDEYCGE